ncbi:hypothetical protein Adt_19661 [Abeliophyllum distichum]|uniref:Uncharacterized protein n=1 Tax=Abeliophyllum distichum TaxID=126358 RepID=A0ABD1STK2_9LAMI
MFTASGLRVRSFPQGMGKEWVQHSTLQKLVHMRSDARINGVAAVEGRIISVHFSSKLEAAPVPYPIPVILNAIGGILVGMVTTYAGGVRKISLNPELMNSIL